jgi:hypothetical protein
VIAAGNWSVTFTPQIMPASERFEIYHGAARGPGGYFLVFLGGTFYGVGQNGRINEYAPNIPMLVKKGQDVVLHWSVATGTAPVVTFFFRDPEVGII